MLPGEALSGLISLLCLVAVPEPAQARPHRVDQVPNGQVFGCATCHVTTVGGDARNPFGQTVEAEFLSSVDESGMLYGARTWQIGIRTGMVSRTARNSGIRTAYSILEILPG